MIVMRFQTLTSLLVATWLVLPPVARLLSAEDDREAPTEVAPRLKRELVHSHADALLFGLQFSPDGKRLIAADNSGDVVRIWDVETARPLTTIVTTPKERNGNNYFRIAPDWRTLYTTTSERKVTPVEKNGKDALRFELRGQIRAWDVETGRLRGSFERDPPRGINWTALSPDGSTFFVGEELPGEWEGNAPLAASLCDVKTGRFRELKGNLSGSGTFSRDSRMVAVDELADDGRASSAIVLFDVQTGQRRHTLRMRDPFTRCAGTDFSPDGKLLACALWIRAGDGSDRGRTEVGLWDVEKEALLASFVISSELSGGLSGLDFSPDGRTLASIICQGVPARLFLFDVPRARLVHTLNLGENDFSGPPAFSPDGKLLAVASRVLPRDVPRKENGQPGEVPPPRIHLVEVATGLEVETLVAPFGIAYSLCFSPDGKTLASGDKGRVVLWDVEELEE